MRPSKLSGTEPQNMGEIGINASGRLDYLGGSLCLLV
jgi:hypothetical protein